MARKLLGFLALFSVLTAGFVAVRALSAQAHGGSMGMMSVKQNCPMMRAMTTGAEAALRHSAELGLTEEQAQRLEALQQDHPPHGAVMARMHEIHRRMNAAGEGAVFDEAAARAAFEEMNAIHTEMGLAMLRNRHQVHQILTPEQREMLTAVGRGRMMGGMHGMMEGCPMMKGGMMGGHRGMMQGEVR